MTPEEEKLAIGRVDRGLKALRELFQFEDREMIDHKQESQEPPKIPAQGELAQSGRLQAFMGGFLKWVLRPIAKIFTSIIAALWAVFAPLFFTLAYLAFVVFAVMAWAFVAYQIAWFVCDETASRVLLLLFLAIAPIYAFANSKAWMWLTPGEQAQAEYTADLLAKAIKDKKD
jgi:hypothetical protein